MDCRVHYTFPGSDRAALELCFGRASKRRVLFEESLSDLIPRKVVQYLFLREEYQQEVLAKQRHVLDYCVCCCPIRWRRS